ncbi:MAG: AI-2E family transporter [Candidatus Amulumruptor caecigallinarius]|nr:AI-2E family transporter [Candidatus Amulumruptor caecigallinarius]
MSKKNPITFDQVIRGIIVIVSVLLLVWLANYLRNVLLPFCVACLIAYVLEPLVQFQMKHLKLKKRIWAVMLTLVEVLLIAGGLAWIIIPSTIQEINELEVLIRESSKHKTTLMPPQIQEYVNKIIDPAALRKYLDPKQLGELFSKGKTVLSVTFNVVSHTIEWLLTFIYVIFIMIDYRKLMGGFRKVIPPRYRQKVNSVLDDIKVNMDHYFRSQAVVALCAAVLYSVGFLIVGLPLAVVMGLLVGILYMIPYVQYVTIIPVLILCYLYSLTGAASFWPMVGQCAIVYVVSQCVCDYLITPKIMGKTLGLNPAIILLSLSVWGSLLGILGMIVALPVTALMIAYYKEYVLTPKSLRFRNASHPSVDMKHD